MSLATIGYACGLGAANTSCTMGPLVLQGSKSLEQKPLDWQEMLYARDDKTQLAAIPAIVELNQRLGQWVYEQVKSQTPFLVLGGDQTASLGTWSGASAACKPKSLGLIWIDAHLDAHTPDTSLSKNLHGMPLAALLGYGDLQMTGLFDFQPKLKPENLVIIGARSYEPEEQQLLQDLGVHIDYMEQVRQKGIVALIQEAVAKLADCDYLGLSIDLDAIDPGDAPATGYHVADGIAGNDLIESLKYFRQCPNLIGMEIVEFNPYLDVAEKTERLISELIYSIYP